MKGRKCAKAPMQKTIDEVRRLFESNQSHSITRNTGRWKYVDGKLYYAIPNYKKVYGMNLSMSEADQHSASLGDTFDPSTMTVTEERIGDNWYWIPKEEETHAVFLDAHVNEKTGAHNGDNKTRSNIKNGLVLINNIERLVTSHLSACSHCQLSRRGANAVPPPPYRYIVPDYPLQHIYMDLTFLVRDGKDIGLLVVVDHFTKYAWVTTIKDKKASTVVDFIENLFQNEFKLSAVDPGNHPPRPAINLRSDNGGEFVAHVVREVCDKYGVRKMEGAAYSPWLQGLVERLNQTLKRLLKQLMQMNKTTKWKHLVASVLDQYLDDKHSTIAVSPRTAWNTCYCPDVTSRSIQQAYLISKWVILF